MLLCMSVGYSQRTDTIVLKEVVLNDAKLLHFSNGIKVSVLKDSVLQKNGTSLTDVLRYNSAIYFKENGYGMVSSPSFRGTNASQTAVVWNGININSQLSGQTDFNTVATQNFDEISIRHGGGSVQYGSGAIGGTVLLHNSLEFIPHTKSNIRVGVASFNMQNYGYKTSYGNKKVALNIGASHVTSDNNYKYLGTDRENENGEFSNTSFNANLGYYIAANNLIKLYQTTFFGDRNFSGTLTAPSNDNYKDVNSRTLLEWDNFKENKIARLKLAHLYEKYKYAPNKERSEFSFGKANNYILNYDYKYQLGNITLNGIANAAVIKAEGSSIEKAERINFSTIFLMSHTLTDKFNYGINLRKDYDSDFTAPFLFSFDSEYKVSKKYAINLNTSKNHRIPTFNDLYWVGAGAVGNREVKPETSLQVELGNSYHTDNIDFNVASYYISSKDLIQWRPNDLGVWSPINIANVSQYGVEVGVDFKYNWNQNYLVWKNQYAYTKSINDETKFQLLYVPKHTISSNISYQYKKVGISYQTLYNGEVFTTTDNTATVDAYVVGNLLFNYAIKWNRKIQTNIIFKVKNIFNAEYQNIAFRPMPNRNYQLELITKF